MRRRICAVWRLVRSNSLAALENVALWHEQDISHSSMGQVIMPDQHNSGRLPVGSRHGPGEEPGGVP